MSAGSEKIYGLIENMIHKSKSDSLILTELIEILKVQQNVLLLINSIKERDVFEKERIFMFLITYESNFTNYTAFTTFISDERSHYPNLKVTLSKHEEIKTAVKEKISQEELQPKAVQDRSIENESESKLMDDQDIIVKQESKDKTGEKNFVPSSARSKGPGAMHSKPQVQPPASSVSEKEAPSSAMPAPTILPPPPIKMEKSKRKVAESKMSNKESKKKIAYSPTPSSKAVTMDIVEEEKEEFDKEGVETGKRGVLIDYYSRMNINQVYDFSIKIDKEVLQARKKQTDILTGEQREQIADEITVVENLPIEVELNIPGCLVSPSVQYISPSAQTSQIIFYVTPYVKFSKRNANVTIGQDKLHKKLLDFQVSVIDRRIMKIMSLIGVLIAAIPNVWPYLFKIDMNDALVTSAKTVLPLMNTEIMIAIELVLGVVVTGSSLTVFKIYSSKRSSFVSTQFL